MNNTIQIFKKIFNNYQNIEEVKGTRSNFEREIASTKRQYQSSISATENA